jgi:hypothetical protein
VRNTNRSVT